MQESHNIYLTSSTLTMYKIIRHEGDVSQEGKQEVAFLLDANG
jgi:hypothetical protein